MNWDKTDIILLDGTKVAAQSPVIISASRSTDIPAFYGDWFVNRFKIGNVKWINPFSGSPHYVSFQNTRLIVFWSKNPAPFIKHLRFFDELDVNYYFQFTLNDYESEGFERKVPPLNRRVETFIQLSEMISKEKVIWRFDPLILTDSLEVSNLLRKIEFLGEQVYKHTRKLVISFADIGIYRKVEANLKREKINYIEFDDLKMEEVAKGIQQLNDKWKLEIGTCSEKIDLEHLGIVHNKCIDENLIISLFEHDHVLMDFFGVKIDKFDLFKQETSKANYSILKDKGQREFCGCIMSKDIGQYNTCPHDCIYCYANTSIEMVKKNYNAHQKNQNGDTIIGI